ncbi:hypothetical protein JW823_04055 [bacterium]|nr:hypothetical protein [candidate division CSSED10-310 bacterium]
MKKYQGSEEFQKDMKDFETLLKKMRAEFNQHLIGNLKTPPDFTVAITRKLVRKYAGDRTLRGTQRFQYFNLVAKFNTMMEFYNRRIRDKELGKQTSFGIIREGSSPEIEAARKKARQMEPVTPDKGHIVANPQRQFTTLKKMYETWTEYSNHLNLPPDMDFDKFQRVITQKTEQLLSQKQCKAIRYKLTVTDGKIKIQAKPIK